MRRAVSQPGRRSSPGNGRRLASRARVRDLTRSSVLLPAGSSPIVLTVARDSSAGAVAAAEAGRRGDVWRQSTAHQAGPECAECEDCFQLVPLREMRAHRRGMCPERVMACPNPGCATVTTAAELPRHLRNACAHTLRGHAMARRGRDRASPQPCRLNCGRKVTPSDRKVHEELECLRRTIRCYACRRRVRLSDLRTHLHRSCPVGVRREELAAKYRSEAEARNRCPQCDKTLGSDVAPSAMRRHLAEACPLRTLTCPLPGCGKKFQARHADRHSREECVFGLTRGKMASSARSRARTERPCPQCKERVPVLQLRRHREDECRRRAVTCPHEGCGEEVAAEDLAGHLEHSCPSSVLRADLAERARLHEEVVPCPRGCGEERRRCDLQGHMDRDCALRLVPCPNASTGCGTKVPARDVPAHLAKACAVEARRYELAALHAKHTEPAVCDLGCGARVPVRRMDHHAQYECPRRHTQCPDCGEQVRVSDVTYHRKQLCQSADARHRRLLKARARERYPPPHVLPPPDKSRREEVASKKGKAKGRKPVWM